MYYPRNQRGSNSTFTATPPVQPSSWDNNVYIIWTTRIFLLFGIPFLLHKIYQFYQTRRPPRRSRPNRGRAVSTLNTVTGLLENMLGQSSSSNLTVDFGPPNTLADGNASDLTLAPDVADEGIAGPQMPANATQRPMPTYDPSRHEARRGLDTSIERR